VAVNFDLSEHSEDTVHCWRADHEQLVVYILSYPI